MYNLKEAKKRLIHGHAYLARAMARDSDPPTLEEVEKWRESAMDLLSMFNRAHAEIARLRRIVEDVKDVY